VAVYAALTSHADRLRAAGDPRRRGQIMADTLVERVTGQALACEVPVRVNLTVSDRVLFGAADEPAQVEGYGPIPAGVARTLLANSLAGKGQDLASEALSAARHRPADRDGLPVPDRARFAR
jgi:hypothetical protein